MPNPVEKIALSTRMVVTPTRKIDTRTSHMRAVCTIQTAGIHLLFSLGLERVTPIHISTTTVYGRNTPVVPT